MKLQVKLVGTFSKFLPENSNSGITTVDTEDGSSVSQLIGVMNIPHGTPCIVSVNNQLVPSSERASKFLEENDEVKIIPPLKGG